MVENDEGWADEQVLAMTGEGADATGSTVLRFGDDNSTFWSKRESRTGEK